MPDFNQNDRMRDALLRLLGRDPFRTDYSRTGTMLDDEDEEDDDTEDFDETDYPDDYPEDFDAEPEEDASLLMPTQLVLDFSSFWERGNRFQSGIERWTRFWESRRDSLHLESATDSRAAFKEWVERVWPSGVPGSMIMANITLEGAHPRWSIRPPVEGPRADSFAAGEFAPTLIAYRRQGRLTVSDFDYMPNVPPRPHERRVSAPVFHNIHGVWMGDLYMEGSDIDLLANLPRRREQANHHLELWQQYLSWKEKLVRSQQLTYRYERMEVREDGAVLAFVLMGRHEVSLLTRQVKGSELLIAPLEASQQAEKWDPTPKAEARLKIVGEVFGVRSRTSGRKEGERKPGKAQKSTEQSEGSDPQNSEALTEVELLITPDEEDPERLDAFLKRLPESGWLLSPLAGELAPIQNQRKGIDRLRDGKTFANNLGDWLFSSENALPPLSIPDVFLAREPLAQLNQDQRSAVNKALAAPDVCLLQGPPGTGKTTVIAEICYQTALNGGRALVASQTNLAVDNALSRLANRPEMRPLRIGQPDRVGEEYKEFLEENVVERWFKGIRQDCAARQRHRDGLEKRLLEAREALKKLERLLDRHHNHQQALGQTYSEGERLKALLEQHLIERRELDVARDQETQRQRSLESFAQWLTDETQAPPLMTSLHGTHVARCLQEESTGLASSLRGLRLAWRGAVHGIASAPDGALGSLDGLRRLKGVLSSLEVKLEEALHLCRGESGGSADETRQLSALLEEKARLVDSDDEDDLRRLQRINGELKRLKEGRWSGVTGELRRLMLPHLSHTEEALEQVLASLKPEASFMALLQQISNDRERLTQVLAALPSRIERLSEAVNMDLKGCKDRLAQLSLQFEAQGNRRKTLEQQEERLARRKLELSAEGERIRLDWATAWSKTSPDGSEFSAEGTAPGPDPHAIKMRGEAIAAFEHQHGSAMTRHQRWRQIQDEWLERLKKPSDSDRERLKDLYVRHCNVVGLTCHEAGRWQFWDKADFRPFDVVIVDEVSKATPPELILPMLLGRKIVLVGDHRQLPPMFKERESSFQDAVEEGELKQEDFKRFEKMVTASLFQTLFEQAAEPLRHALYVQYRMHPTIMEAINQFYEHRLKAGPSPEKLDQRRQHRMRIEDLQGAPLLEPGQHLLWVDSSRDEKGRESFEQQQGSSKSNALEVQLARALLLKLNETLAARGYGPLRKEKATRAEAGLTVEAWTKRLLKEPPDETLQDLFQLDQILHNGRLAHRGDLVREGDELVVDGRKPVGLITFYGAQLREMRKMRDQLRADSGSPLDAIELRINTVDRFQGMERPIVIVSLVRAQKQFRGGDFVRQFQRINVALSRAQELLVILGAERTFTQASVELPPLTGGEPVPVPAYRNIWDHVKLLGGRRYASQLLG